MSKKNNKTNSQAAKVTPVKANAKNGQAASKSNQGLLISLVVVLVAALIVIGVMFSQNNSKNDQLAAANAGLTDVTAKYEATKSERDELKKQLDDAEEALDEANLALEESSAMVARLTDEVSNLTAQNTANTETIAAKQAELDRALAVQSRTQTTVDEVMVLISTLQQDLAASGFVTLETEEPEAPAEEPEAPAEEPEAPAEETEAPAEEPEAPAEETEAPAEETEAPAEETEVPAEETATATDMSVPVEDEAPLAVETEETAEVETTEPAEETEETAEVETTEEAVEPEAAPAVEYPVVNVTDEGTVIETETAVVTVTMDENNAIATLTATVNGEAVAEDVTALFIGKALPLNAEEFTLDEAGMMQAIIDALAALAEPALVNG